MDDKAKTKLETVLAPLPYYLFAAVVAFAIVEAWHYFAGQ